LLRVRDEARDESINVLSWQAIRINEPWERFINNFPASFSKSTEL
jgi:hypothetical protein